MSEHDELVKRLNEKAFGAWLWLSEAAQAIERLEGRVTELETYSRALIGRDNVTMGHMVEHAEKAEQQLADARTETEQHNGLLRECQAFLFDDSGTPISPEDLRERVREALATPAPGKDSEGKD